MAPSINLKDILNSKVNAPKEEANAKDWNFKPSVPPGMTVHIELSRTVTDGEITITADINNQADLDGFMEKCKGYMPRKKWLGLI